MKTPAALLVCMFVCIGAASSAGQEKPAPLTLAELERLALEVSPTVARAEAMVRATEGQVKQAGLWPNPAIGATGEHVTPVLGGGSIGGFFEQRFLTGGKLRYDRKVAEGDHRVARERSAGERQRLLNAVRMLFYQGLAEQRLIEVRGELVALARRAVQISRELKNVGQADQPDLLASEIEAERIELALATSRSALERTRRQLAALVNRPSLGESALTGELDGLPDLAWDKALERLLAESPALRAAHAEVERAEASLDRARAGRAPDVTARAGVRNNREFADGRLPLRRVGPEAIFDLAVDLPVFNRNQGAIAAASADLDAARAHVSGIRLELRARFAEEYREYQTARETAGRYRASILPKAEEAYKLYLGSFRQMAAAFPQVLVAQRSLFQLQSDHVEALESAWMRYVLIDGLLAGAEDRGRD